MTLDALAISSRFAAALAAPGPSAIAPVLGIEHEYMVYRAGSPVDFRDLIHTAGLDGVLLHPTDRHRYLTPSGVALMADGIVAEVASPPEPLRPGVTARLEHWGGYGYARFAEALPPDTRLKGVSTHLSVECPPGLEDEVAWRYAQLFSPALMLLLDDADSPGLLIRPRPSRIELGGEYAVGPRLKSAVAFAAGSVIALIQAVRDGRPLPLPSLDVALEPARRRFGWYVDRHAFGSDLYRDGRAAVLRDRSGRTFSAQEHLARCWAVARAAISNAVAIEDLEAVDDVVARVRNLPAEVAIDRAPARVPPEPVSHPIGEATRPRLRDGFHVRPLAATWDFVAFEVSDGDRALVGSVPRSLLERFLALLDGGSFDRLLLEALRARLADRVLASAAQTDHPGLFGTILLTAALLPRDRPGVGGGAFASMAIGKLPLSVLLPTAASATATTTVAATTVAAVPQAPVAVTPGVAEVRPIARRSPSIPGSGDGPIDTTPDAPSARRSIVPPAIAFLVLVFVLAGAFVVFRSGGDDGSAPASGGSADGSGNAGATAGSGTASSQPTAAATEATATSVASANPLEDLVATQDLERIAQFFDLYGSPAPRVSATTYTERRPDPAAAPIEWVDGVSAFFFLDDAGEVWVRIDAPRELATNLCGEVDIITGRNQHAGDGIDFCAEDAAAAWYLVPVSYPVPGNSPRVTIVVRSGQVIVELDDRISIWALNGSDPDNYQAVEFVGQALAAEPLDADDLDVLVSPGVLADDTPLE